MTNSPALPESVEASKLRAQGIEINAGLTKAADWIARRRDDYVNEHGSYDPETNSTEFPGTGEEYVGELDEIEEGIRALITPAEGAETPTWRCFHCDEVFTDEHSARLHFGNDETAAPACQIKGSEHGLVEALREAENDAAKAQHALLIESTDAAKAYYSQNSRHQRQMRAIEQVGYDRGIADARAYPETLGLVAVDKGAIGEEASEPNTYASLREANVARQAAWCPEQLPDLSFRGNELAGETGEVCNVIKKLERERLGWRGSRDTIEHLAEELADVVICADLCAISSGIDLDKAVEAKFNATSEKVGLPHRLRALSTREATPLEAEPSEAEVEASLDALIASTGGRLPVALSDMRAALLAARRIQPDRDGVLEALQVARNHLALLGGEPMAGDYFADQPQIAVLEQVDTAIRALKQES